MEWIFDNFFIVIIIISAILGFFKNNDEQNKKQEKKKPVPSRPRTVQPERKRQPRAESKVFREEPREKRLTISSVEEQQKAQIERLASKYKGKVASEIDDFGKQVITESLLNEPEKDPSVNREKMKKQVVSNLSAKGLVNGIIMSEVLGPPRAKKSYQNILKDRLR